MLTQQLLNGVITGVLYGIASLGLGLVYGIFHVPNMAHGAIYMFGAFLTLVFCQINYFLGIFTAIICVGIMMVLNDFLVFRPLRKRNGDSMSMMIASIGIEYVLLNLALHIWKADPRGLPVPWEYKVFTFLGMSLAYQRILILLISIVTVVVISYVVKKTKYGRAMRACAQDMKAAKIMGINTNRIAIVTFAISGALAALAGGLIGPLTMVYPSMGNSMVTKAFAVVILGGGISIPGVMIGGIVLGITEAITAQLTSSQFIDLAAFLVLLLVLIFKPSGLFGKNRPVKV